MGRLASRKPYTSGAASMMPLLAAVAAGQISGREALAAWEAREGSNGAHVPLSRDAVAQERPEQPAAGQNSIDPTGLQICADRFALFGDRLPNVANDKDRWALRNLGYTGGWS